MMGNMQKVDDGSMTLQIKGAAAPSAPSPWCPMPWAMSGAASPSRRVPLVEKYPGKLDVGATVGTDGTLTVIRDLQMKEPYIGSTLVSGEIGDDVTAYFAQSEQTPTACALGVLVDRDQSVKVAGGYLFQLLPDAPEATISALEQGIQKAGAVTPMLDKGMNPEDNLADGLRRSGCGHSGEAGSFLQVLLLPGSGSVPPLLSLGRGELEEIIAEDKAFPVECQFCDAVYSFTPEDIREMLEKPDTSVKYEILHRSFEASESCAKRS